MFICVVSSYLVMTTETERGGFSHNPLMIGYDNRIFEADEELGFCFPGRKLIGTQQFYSLEEIIESVRRNNYRKNILNIGDSSTSGWDSNKVFKRNQDPLAPFFNYKTYSDLLAETTCFWNVINAGVPGYTSYQGKKYLSQLLRKLSKEGIRVDYVTIYFGNNDCTYNQIEDKVSLDGKVCSSENRGERVAVGDYERNLGDMIEIVKDYGAKPILIVPLAHYDWEPGIRSDKYRQESLEALAQLNGSYLQKELEEARELYSAGRYKEACEKDRLIPRLKQRYRKIIFRVAKKTGTEIIDIQDQILLTDNAEYFADYCHPLEKVNKMILEKIEKIREKDIFHRSFKKRFGDWISSFKRKNSDGTEKPLEIYTLW